MNSKGLTFEKARGIVKGMLIAAAALCVLGLVVNANTGNEMWAAYATYGAVGCVVVALFFVFVGLKCPYCGKQIFRNCLVVKSCPHCHRNLTTGLKAKKKKDR